MSNMTVKESSIPLTGASVPITVQGGESLRGNTIRGNLKGKSASERVSEREGLQSFLEGF